MEAFSPYPLRQDCWRPAAPRTGTTTEEVPRPRAVLPIPRTPVTVHPAPAAIPEEPPAGPVTRALPVVRERREAYSRAVPEPAARDPIRDTCPVEPECRADRDPEVPDPGEQDQEVRVTAVVRWIRAKLRAARGQAAWAALG